MRISWKPGFAVIIMERSIYFLLRNNKGCIGGFVARFAPGLSAALALIPNIIGGNFSLSAEDQTKIIDGLTKYYAEEFRKAQLLTYMKTFESTIGKGGNCRFSFHKLMLN